MFLGLLDPDPHPLVRGTDPDPSMTSKNSKKALNFYCFVTFYVIWKVTDKIPGSGAGSGVGSVSQSYGTSNPVRTKMSRIRKTGPNLKKLFLQEGQAELVPADLAGARGGPGEISPTGVRPQKRLFV